jgi:hypothetical protein
MSQNKPTPAAFTWKYPLSVIGKNVLGVADVLAGNPIAVVISGPPLPDLNDTVPGVAVVPTILNPNTLII